MAQQHSLLPRVVGGPVVQLPSNHTITRQERSSTVFHGPRGQIAAVTQERVETSTNNYPPVPQSFSVMTAWKRSPQVSLMYDEKSTVKFLGQRVEGLPSVEHTVKLREHCCRNATVCDFDSIPQTGGTVVTVGGEVQIPEEHQPRMFHQVLILMPIAEGSYYVQNDLFCTIPA